jgi:hypothetical protein
LLVDHGKLSELDADQVGRRFSMEERMGGYGSGRRASHMTVEEGLTVNLGLLMRRGWIKDGSTGSGSLSWSNSGEPVAQIHYNYNVTDPNEAYLILIYKIAWASAPATDVKQRIKLVHTRPNYGGRRWWMLCPATRRRVAKLHLPPGGDRFASRGFWGLSHRSQRSSHLYRPFDRLFRLQSKLGGTMGWGQPIQRPKGMWSSTFQRYENLYWDLSALCNSEADNLVASAKNYTVGA